MSENMKKFDILGDILNDSSTGAIRGLDELNMLIYASPKNLLPNVALNPSHVQKKKRKQTRRHKTTHYLTEEVFGSLGEAKADVRDFLPEASKSQATKSRIIESAITVVLQEFEKKGKDSALIQELLKKKSSGAWES
jgi:CRISPR/Cas system CSM-associated protein Csm4 (group 5 of RAMP superfamily)